MAFREQVVINFDTKHPSEWIQWRQIQTVFSQLIRDHLVSEIFHGISGNLIEFWRRPRDFETPEKESKFANVHVRIEMVNDKITSDSF